MLPVGLIGFMLPQVLEEGFYADPPKNKFEGLCCHFENARFGCNAMTITSLVLLAFSHRSDQTLHCPENIDQA